MIVPKSTAYRSHALSLLERLVSGSFQLVYIDDFWQGHPIEIQGGTILRTFEDYVEYLSKVIQQAFRLLGPKGALCFHGRSTISTEVTFLIDAIFGKSTYRESYVWPQSLASSSRGPSHETLLICGRSEQFSPNPVYKPVEANRYTKKDERGPYRLLDITVPGVLPSRYFEWKGFLPPEGRSWRYTSAQMLIYEHEGRLVYSGGGRPRIKEYLSESRGVLVGTLWDDIKPGSPARVGEAIIYTGGSLALAERIVQLTCQPGDTLLDPFSGTGTMLVASWRNRCAFVGCTPSEALFPVLTERLKREGLQEGIDFSISTEEDLKKAQPAAFAGYRAIQKPTGNPAYVQAKPVEMDETRVSEFKEVKGSQPTRSIIDKADNYIVGFLNSEGGSIYWGIRDDDKTVRGVTLSGKDRDRIRRDVVGKVIAIQPSIDPLACSVLFHPVYSQSGEPISDCFVVEISVPHALSTEPYYTGDGELYVRLDGVNKRLIGPQVTRYILGRLST